MNSAQEGVALARTSEALPLEEPGHGQRIAGMLIVLAVAFLPSIVVSIFVAWGIDRDVSDTYIRYRYFNGMLMELSSLALLAYVVRQNKQTVMDLGIAFRFRDVAFGVLLWILSLCCYRLAYPSILSACELMGWHRTPPYVPSVRLGLGLLTYCFVVVNPIFEETIVRAFLMSETVALTGSTAAAIVFSTLLQTSYHIYQGIPYALSAAVIFLIFSVYYARTHRILPVIVAHFIMDLWAHVSYALLHAPAKHP